MEKSCCLQQTQRGIAVFLTPLEVPNRLLIIYISVVMPTHSTLVGPFSQWSLNGSNSFSMYRRKWWPC